MDDASAAYALDTMRMRRSFDRASAGYDDAAVLQTDVRARLLERLELTALQPRLIIDAGAGTGHASRALIARYPGARVLAVDSSFGMLRAAARQRSLLRRFDRVCADVRQLPLADASADLILSNLLLQWCDPDEVFAEFRRVLAPRGAFCFSSVGPDTLWELRRAWAAVDAHTHVHRFLDMHDVGDALVRAGFAAPVLDVERYTLHYAQVLGLTADLKAGGAHNASAGRPRGLTGPRKFAAMRTAYEAHRREGRLPATVEVVFGQAWAPLERMPRGASGTQAVTLDEIRRRLAQSRGR